MAKLVAHLLATAALWVRIQTSLEKLNWLHKQRSGKHTLARKKINNKKRILLQLKSIHTGFAKIFQSVKFFVSFDSRYSFIHLFFP